MCRSTRANSVTKTEPEMINVPFLPFRASQTWLSVLLAIAVLSSLASRPSCAWYQNESVQAPALKAQATTAAEDKATELADLIEKMRSDWDVPGLSVAIVKDGETILSRGFGTLQAGQAQKVNQDTLFAIASNTKAFTAAALAILVDEGKLAWDDHVSKYLPWLELSDPLVTADLRVRDLLCHRSGLGTFSGDLLWWQTTYTPRQVLERVKQLKPAGPFRAHYGYSNLMFLAAGEVIREVSGQSWSDFVSTRLLQPSNMQRTITSTLQLDTRQNYAMPHKTHPDLSSEPLPWVNWDSMVAAGGIISSASDMSNWMKIQLARGKLDSGDSTKDQLFSRKQSHEMWHPQTIIPVTASASSSSQYRAYGLGWSLRDYEGHKVVGHGGGYDGMYSRVQLVPEENLGVVVLTNSMTSVTGAITDAVLRNYLRGESPGEALASSTKSIASFRKGRESFQSRINDSVQPRSAGTNTRRPNEQFTGQYRCPLYGDATVSNEEGRLVLKLLPAEKLVADLQHLHFNTYRIRWRSTMAWFSDGTCHFVDDANGNIVRIELDVPNDDMFFYELDLRRIRQ